jgi:drug/metabolite transporter (DMT)-like permease
MSQLSDTDIQNAFNRARTSYSKKIIGMTIGMVVTGCASTTLFKYQTRRQGLPANSISLQTFFVFISQFLNLILFFIKITLNPERLSKHFLKYRNRSYSNGRQYEFPSTKIIPSSLFSCVASLLQLYALTSLSSGFFQMLFGFGIIFTPLLSAFFLHRSLYPHIKAGILICALGFVIVVLSSYLLGIAGFENDGGWTAIFVMLLGVFFSSCQRVHQEHLHNQVEISPFRYSGLEGFYGTLILFAFHIFMAGYNYVRGTSYFDIATELLQWYQNDDLVWSSIILILCLSIYDLLGIVLVAHTGATYRVTNEVIRVIFLWVIDLVLYKPYEMSPKYWVNFCFILLAYVFLLFGTFVINEVIELTVCGLNKYFGLYRKSIDVNSESINDSGLQGRPVETLD